MGLIGVSFADVFVILILGFFTIICRFAQGNSNLCDTRQFAKPAFNESGAYWKCEPFPTSRQTGAWRLLRCKKNEAFSKVDQICKPRSTIRRQQSLCQMQPNLPMCQEQNCGASNYNPALGGQCSWTNAGLMPTSSSSMNFMQCTPSSVGSACGTWNQMQCASGTSFNPVFQVCVVQQSMCSPTNVAVCPCGVANACPPPCSCVNGVCCYPGGGDQASTPPSTFGPQFYTTPPYTPLPPIYPQLPMCPNGQRALSSCYQDSNCQHGFYCRDGGCCPLPQCPNGQTAMQACDDMGRNCTIDYVCRDTVTCPNGQTATQVCVGTGQANCPPSFVCMNGGCCLAPRCPSGDLAVQSCSGYGNECPNGYSCQNGACCRMLMCPNGQSATQSCDASHQCMPGYSCQNGACCLQPMCPNGQPSSQTCSGGYGQGSCPPGQSCQNGACCPLPTCPNGQPAHQTCSGYGQSNCPPGHSCQNGGCCPQPTCPNGLPASQTCSGYGQSSCPPGHTCQNGACCPLPMCSNSQPASQMCSGYGQSNCPPNFTCQNGGCCPQPLCPSGQPAASMCSGYGQSSCPPNHSCLNGGCCPNPLPMCPRGHQATAFCSGVNSCQTGQYCYNGGCCPVPQCPTGQLAIQPCDSNYNCPLGYSCQEGGCCPLGLPMCPNTHTQATVQCTGPGTCPSGQYCFVDSQGKRGCCSIPTCANNVPSVQACSPESTCPVGLACENGACCPPPICPNGQPGVQACHNGGACPSGLTCQNNVCCPPVLPTCPTGYPAEKPCNADTDCGGYGGYACIHGGCCRAPLTAPPTQMTLPPAPVCPDGRWPLQTCGPSNYCPDGYQCYNGQCCPTTTHVFTTAGPSTQQQCQVNCCPVLQISLCQCANYNNMCPSGSSCNMGVCCAAPTSTGIGTPLGPAPYGQLRPGDRCHSDTECPGYPGTASCRLGNCVCTGESKSNGISCVIFRRRYDPYNQCGQFGTDCKKFQSRNRRRRPLSADDLGIKNDTVPLWWYPISENSCVTDKECTPDHICVQKKCYPLLKPGDFNCKFDEQCNRTAENSQCFVDKQAKINVCRCSDGKFEFANRCWKECPMGTMVNGGNCVTVKMEKSSLTTFAKKLMHIFSPYKDDPVEEE